VPTIPNGFGFINDGFSVGPPVGVSRVAVGGGMARYAVDYARGKQMFSGAMRFTELEYTIWEAFYRHVIAEGTIAFDMDLDSGMGVSTHSVNIVPGTYATQRVAGDKTEVSFSVETESEIYTLTEAEALTVIDDFETESGRELVNVLRPMVASYGGDGPDGPWRSETAGGNAQFARAWARSCQRYTVTIPMSAAEYLAWTAYLHHVIHKGAAPFRLYLDTGMGPSRHLVQMMPASYRATRSGARTMVTFVAEAQTELYDLSTTDGAGLVDMWNSVGSDLDGLLEAIEQFANDDLAELA
jgi:hypothetical protein